MKTKLLALLLVLCLILCACGTDNKKAETTEHMISSGTSQEQSQTETTIEATEAAVIDPTAHLRYRNTIAAGDDTSMAILRDGSVAIAGCEIKGDIDPKSTYVSVDCYNHYILLKSDGTASAGLFDKGSAISKSVNVDSWTDLVAVSAGMTFSAGLKSDGTVVVTEGGASGNDKAAEWTDIVMIDAGYFLVGLKSDGTVVAALPDNIPLRSKDFENWTDIIAISTSSSYIMGLKSDGTVVAWSSTANNPKLDVSGWTDIVQISAGLNHAIGLKADGTVVSTEITDKEYDRGETQVEGWTDVVAIAANYTHTLAIKSDGTVISAGTEDACDVSEWAKAQLP